ncbi:MAG: carboxypeptidase regulatory-like domain-containing protein [Myxococcales bacterium]|nr:carboxypeptidase regulatory-like domain-containing protein [Myxococcales bacterium]
MKMRHSSIAVALLLGCLGASSCAMESARSCIDNLDCPLNQRCESFRCVNFPSIVPTSVVAIEIHPGGIPGSAFTPIPELDLKDPEVDIDELEIETMPASRLQGTIDSPFAPGGVPGNLTASRDPAIDSRKLSFSIPVDDAGYFDFEVTPSGPAEGPDRERYRYQLVFSPVNRADLPQLGRQDFPITSGATAQPDFKYPVYPAPENIESQTRLLLLRGKLLQSPAYPHPPTGYRVEGITAEGLRTNLVGLDAEGRFWLRLPVLRSSASPCDGERCFIFPTHLALVIRPESSEARLPTIRVPDVSIDSYDLGTFFIGELPASRALSGTVTAADGSRLAEAWLFFTADRLGNGSFTYSVQTDSAGTFATTLPAGGYRVLLVPPDTAPARMEAFRLELWEDFNDWQLSLPPRLALSGTVRDFQKNAVPEVTVWATRMTDLDGNDDGVVRRWETQTDGLGRFTLALDAGRYNLEFVPPAVSRLPREQKTGFAVSNDTLDFLDVELPPPAFLQGHVFDSRGQPLCGATLSIFKADPDRAFLIGETISGGSSTCTGAFTVIIPGILVAP